MKRPFVVGDRVAVYSCKREVGVIIEPPTHHHTAGNLWVEFHRKDGSWEKTLSVHPKQCRRLIKKKLRSILIQCGKDGELSHTSGKLSNNVKFYWEGRHSVDDGYVEFVEVKK